MLSARKESQMGKSLKGKELGKGITQRKDGLYQGRFTNRFGKKETVYSKSLNELRQKLRKEQYEDENGRSVIKKDMTLDEWYKVWMDTCKKNCRSSTKETYAREYKRVQEALGWMKLTKLNLIVMQQAINELNSDNERRTTKKILVDMLEKAILSDLLTKNVAKQINTIVTHEEQKKRRVLTRGEEEDFRKQAEGTFYYNLYILALETGLRIGEIMGLMWSDIDFENRVLRVKRSLCYFRKNGTYTFEMHDTKTKNGKRAIPLTQKAFEALKKQKEQKQEIVQKGHIAPEGYEDLVFVTKNNKPTQQFIVQECISLCVNHIQKTNPEYQGVSPHCFRHTFATRAIENGMQPKTLQMILGHGSLRMTMDLYCHVTDETLFDAMKLMEKKCG